MLSVEYSRESATLCVSYVAAREVLDKRGQRVLENFPASGSNVMLGRPSVLRVVPNSFSLLLVRHLLLEAMHLFLIYIYIYIFKHIFCLASFGK